MREIFRASPVGADGKIYCVSESGTVVILEAGPGTGAVTRVLVDSTDGERTWTTIGVSENIIEASWQALYDSIVFGLLHTS